YFSLRRKFAEKLGWHSSHVEFSQHLSRFVVHILILVHIHDLEKSSCHSLLPLRSPPTVSPVVMLFLSSRDRDVRSAVSVAPAARSCIICTAASVVLPNVHESDRVPPDAVCRRDATTGSSVQKLRDERWGPSKGLESDWIELHFLCRNKINIDSLLTIGNSILYFIPLGFAAS
ncbi:hypothetical protein ALC62_07092, partial [Cyphomyrmex costatus]